MSLPGTGGSLPQHSDVLTATPSGPEDTKTLVAELKRRGNAAFKVQSFFEAETLYAKAIEHDPTSDAALYGNRAAARIGMKRYDEALKDADEAIKLGFVKGHYRRGQALMGLGRHRDAQKAFEKCAELDQANKESLLKEAEKAKAKADEADNADMDIVIEDVSKKPEPKKSTSATTKETSAKKSSGTETKAKSVEKNSVNDDEEDLDPTKMRGYKTLEDGRKTTFFHMEIDPEQKAKLAAENKPKALSGPVAAPTSGKDGSAWNAAGTFEEKDMSKWAKDKIQELCKAISTVFDAPGGHSGIVEVTNVTDFDGVASVSFIRGSKRFPFDFTFNVEWTASIPEGEVSGKLFYSQFTADEEEFEAEVRWENRYKAGASSKPLLEHLKKDFRKAVDEKLREFISEFHKL